MNVCVSNWIGMSIPVPRQIEIEHLMWVLSYKEEHSASLRELGFLSLVKTERQTKWPSQRRCKSRGTVVKGECR